MNVEIREVKNEELEDALSLLRELRSNLSQSDFQTILKDAQANDQFVLVGLFEDAKIQSLMGYRILFDFVHGKHLYVDDLVTRESARSRGFGKLMMEYAESNAKNLDCKMVRLCSGVDKKDAHRFYERMGYGARSVAFKKSI